MLVRMWVLSQDTSRDTRNVLVRLNLRSSGVLSAFVSKLYEGLELGVDIRPLRDIVQEGLVGVATFLKLPRHSDDGICYFSGTQTHHCLAGHDQGVEQKHNK